MEMHIARHGARLVVSAMPTVFDYTVCPDFQRSLAAYLDPIPPVLILDLSGVDFMDSSAIGSLITIRNRLLPAGGQVALCAIGDRVAKVLRIADLGKVFAIHATVEEALAAHPDPA